jgi:hypothetical protein
MEKIGMDYELNIGQVDISKVQTEEDFRQEASRLVPSLMAQSGEKIGEKAWEELQEGLGNMVASSSASEKAEFIRAFAENYCGDVARRNELIEVIINTLQDMKANSAMREQREGGE